jgi:hypothetical protein
MPKPAKRVKAEHMAGRYQPEAGRYELRLSGLTLLLTPEEFASLKQLVDALDAELHAREARPATEPG